MGVVFFVVYYFLFRFAITKWNMRTPGREPEYEFEAEEEANLGEGTGSTTVVTAGGGGAATATVTAPVAADSKAEQVIAAFGGRENSSTSMRASLVCAWRSPTRARSIRHV